MKNKQRGNSGGKAAFIQNLGLKPGKGAHPSVREESQTLAQHRREAVHMRSPKQTASEEQPGLQE